MLNRETVEAQEIYIFKLKPTTANLTYKKKGKKPIKRK